MAESDSSLAKEILQQINKLRKFPKSFIPILEDNLQYFEGNALFLPNSITGGVLLEEGPASTIKEPLPEIQWNECLERAARDHLNDIGPKGLLSHTGSDKSNYKQRIEKHCQWGGSIFEAIDYGPRENAKEIVIAWLVDDGVPKRVHRNNIFFKDHSFCGIATGDHKTARQCAVAVFAGQVVTQQQIDEHKQQQLVGTIDKKRQEEMQNKDWKKFALEIFDLQNKIRQNPKCFVSYLEKSLQRFNGSVIMTDDGKSGFETQEGQFAYVEAIEFLKGQQSVPPLKWASQLNKAGLDHINDIGPKGLTSSLGSDGSLPTDRLGRYCMIDNAWAESLCFQAVTAHEVLERLIVDDGQAARGHRKNIFNREMVNCGVATGPHSGLDNVILFEYSSAILKEGEMPSINITVQEEVPLELIEKMKMMGIDINKIKVKKDTKDAQLKAQALFKKATNAITFANRMSKTVNDKNHPPELMAQTSSKPIITDQTNKSPKKVGTPSSQQRPQSGFARNKTPLAGSQNKSKLVSQNSQNLDKNSTLKRNQSPFQKALEEKKQTQLKKSNTLIRNQMSPQQSPKIGNNNSKNYLDRLKKQNTVGGGMKPRLDSKFSSQTSLHHQNTWGSNKPKTGIIKYTIGGDEESKTPGVREGKIEKEFNIENDPDMPEDAVNSNVIIEEIEMNGKKQKVYRKTYQLIDGRTVAITRMEQM